MEPGVAERIAVEYLEREGVAADFDWRRRDKERLSASLESLITPEVGDIWAIVDATRVTSREELTVAIILTEGTVYKCEFSREGEATPQVLVMRFPEDRWRVTHVGVQVSRDSASAPQVARVWSLELGTEPLAFRTEHLLAGEPPREERLGRALALVHGWRIDDLPRR